MSLRPSTDRSRIARQQGNPVAESARGLAQSKSWRNFPGFQSSDFRFHNRGLQHRLSLDSIATAALGVEKTAEGLQAIQWFKEGRMLEIAEYCCYDVKLTRLVHKYGVQNRQLHHHNRLGKKLSVEVSW